MRVVVSNKGQDAFRINAKSVELKSMIKPPAMKRKFMLESKVQKRVRLEDVGQYVAIMNVHFSTFV